MKFGELAIDVLATALAQQQSDVRKLERRRVTEAEPARDVPGIGGYPPILLPRDCLTDDDDLCSRYHRFAGPYCLGCGRYLLSLTVCLSAALT
jgi:hypothetical protein